MRKIPIIILIMLSIVLTGMTTIYAEMEKSIDIKCQFSYTQFYSVTDGKPETGTIEKFKFVIMGVNKECPLLVGNSGITELIKLPSNAPETIYLVQPMNSGNVNYITIFPRINRVVFIKGYGYMGNMWSQTSIGMFDIIK